MVGLLKFVLASEIRVVTEIPDSFKDLQETCSELFGVCNPCFQYKDSEDDLITLSTEKEYQFILKSYKSNLKLIVISSTKLLANSPRLQLQQGFPIDDHTEGSLMLHIPSLNPPSLIKSTHSVPNYIKPDPFQSDHNFIPEHKTEFDRKHLLSETLRKSLPAETIHSQHFICSFCNCEIIEMLFVCLQCDKHIMCLECEQKDLRKHILIKCKLQDVCEILKIRMTKRKSFHLIKKNQRNEDSLNEEISENEEKFKAKALKETRGKEETLQEKVKKDSKKKLHTLDNAENLSKKTTKDVPNTKKKHTFTKKHDDHETLVKETSRSFNEIESNSDDLSEKKKTRAGLAKTPQVNQYNNTQINALMEKLSALGFNNKTQNYNALNQAKYQLEVAINLLLNNGENS